MERSPVSDWQELSALYEEADDLDAEGCAALLGRLRAAGHPQVIALERMLHARDRARTDGFMDHLPSFAASAVPRTGDAAVAPGDHFGPYSLLRRLGSGGMAQVWLAERDDGAFQRHVAIKLPFRHADGAQRETLVQRFARERDILAALHHPNIAALHDAGVTPAGQPWLALEMVAGEPVTDWCDRQRLPVRERVRLFRQVLRAVQHAHANLVIHRDLKPANILVTPQGNVRLLDFGIAKLIEPIDGAGASLDSALTREGGTPLTLLYASPEQIGGRPLSTACDVYALGVVLYELLAGARPYELKVDTAAQLEQAILEQEPRAPSRREASAQVLAARNADARQLRRELAPDLDAIVLRALAKQPQERYASVEALLGDLERWLAGRTVSARRPSAWYWLRKFASRHRVGVALGVATVSALVAVTTMAVVFGLHARRQAELATASRSFLIDMFRLADPEQSKGSEITAREILDTARRRTAALFSAQPEVHAETLVSIADIESYVGDYRAAANSLDQVVAIRRRAGAGAELADALVARADVALNMGDSTSAERLLAEAQALGPGLRSHESLVRLYEVETEAALSRGDGLAARAAARRMRAHAEQVASAKRDSSVLDALRMQVALESSQRNYAAARAFSTEAVARAASGTGIEPRTRVAIDYERSAVEVAAGSYRVANELLKESVAHCDAVLTARSEACLMLRQAWALVLLRLGHVDRAHSLVPALMRQVDSPSSPRRQAESLTIVCRVLSAKGQLAVNQELLRRLAEFGRSGSDVTQAADLKAHAMLAYVESLLREGATSQAETLIEQAIQEQRVAPSVGARERGIAFMLLGIGRQARGDHVHALEAFDAADGLFSQGFGPDHVLALYYGLNRARSMQAVGQGQAALAVIDRAWPELLIQFGGDAPVMERIRKLRAGLATPATDDRRPPHHSQFFS